MTTCLDEEKDYNYNNPVTGFLKKFAPVAQSDRATDFGSVGCGFESYRARFRSTRGEYLRVFLFFI
jgi:hypothetical protein